MAAFNSCTGVNLNIWNNTACSSDEYDAACYADEIAAPTQPCQSLADGVSCQSPAYTTADNLDSLYSDYYSKTNTWYDAYIINDPSWK